MKPASGFTQPDRRPAVEGPGQHARRRRAGVARRVAAPRSSRPGGFTMSISPCTPCCTGRKAREESRPPSPEPLIPPIVLDLSSTLPRTPGLFAPGGWLFSYAAATVITGMAILGAWVYKVSLGGGMGVSPGPVATDQPRAIVARQTGEGACRPDHGHGRLPLGRSARRPAGAAVPLGRKYDLASGLMEITYQSGAKVILQGPCTL